MSLIVQGMGTTTNMDSGFASETADTAAGRQLEEGFPRLRFGEPLEREFRRGYKLRNLRVARSATALGALIVLAYSLLDWFLLPAEVSTWSITTRLVAVSPAFLIAILAGFFKEIGRNLYGFVIAASVVAGALIVGLEIFLAKQGISYQFSSLILLTIFIHFFSSLLCFTAMKMSILIMLGYFVGAYVYEVPGSAFAYNALALLTTNLFAAIGSYVMEHAIRTDFLEAKLLNQLAEQDSLTGLSNRRSFDNHIERTWRHARRDRRPLAILFVDIDYFKSFNDLYGHQAGDDCLRRVASTLARGARRPFDLVARYGGEEFVIVIYDPPSDYIARLPEQLRVDVAALNIAHVGSAVAGHLTVSIGAAIAVPVAGRSYEGLVQLADEALYAAKEQGRNCVIVKEAEYAYLKTGVFRSDKRERAAG